MRRQVRETGFQEGLGLHEMAPAPPLVLGKQSGGQVEMQQSYTSGACIHIRTDRRGVAVGGVTLGHRLFQTGQQTCRQLWSDLSMCA